MPLIASRIYLCMSALRSGPKRERNPPVSLVHHANRPARMFYIADFDPAGHGMPVSVTRKIEFFLADRNLDLDIRLQPIVLTLPQDKAGSQERFDGDVPPSACAHRRQPVTPGGGYKALQSASARLEGNKPVESSMWR